MGVTGSIPVVTTISVRLVLKFCLFLTVISFFVGALLLQRSSAPTHNVWFAKQEAFGENMKADASYSYPLPFVLLSNIPFFKKRIVTGEYILTAGETAYSFIVKILTGEVTIRKITFPEGFTVQMIVEKLNNEKALVGEVTQMPEEGSLFPSTYFYKRGDLRDEVIQNMKATMERKKQELFTAAQLQSSKFIADIITMASIIEKESHVHQERPLIASVFYNRLEKNMRLQSDPTVIYAISKGYGKIDHPLTRKELWFESPYNSYRNKGLPPGPICCPSEESIKAALFPAKTNFLYFVVNEDNTRHYFTDDYKQHLANIKKSFRKKAA